MFPKLLTAGPFFLPSYGFFVALGVLLGLWITLREARRTGVPTEKVENLAVAVVLVGIVGSKILMFVLDFEYYRRNPDRVLSLETLLSAGVFHGGFLLALLTTLLLVKRWKMPLWETADAFAPGLAMGHAVGRIGCFAAGCCWGKTCDRPWAVRFTDPDAHALTGVPLQRPLHPTQLYETIALFIIFLVLLKFRRRSPGSLFGLYLVLYGSARLGLEFFRDPQQNPPFGGPFSTTQWIAVGLALFGVWLVSGRPYTRVRSAA